MATTDQVYEKLSSVGEDVAALKLHVLGNGGPGLSERLRSVEAAISERVSVIGLVHSQAEALDERLTTLEDFENKEHGAYKFIGIGVPLVAGMGGLAISIIKLASGG